MSALSYLSNDLDEEDDDDEYIDMELMGSSLYSSNSTAHEFEFQMSSSVSIEKEPTNSPADELFYKGKLLPLHLPPRLQMVKKLLQNSITTNGGNIKFKQGYGTTTLESFYISPSESCRVNPELNLEEYLFPDVVNYGGAGEKYTKKPWTKKLKFIKQPSIIGSKLKAYSRVYLKSLFGDHHHTKSTKKNTPPILELGKVDHDHDQHQNGNRHRRSYSLMAIKRHSSPPSSSSSKTSSSSSSNDGYDQNLQVLKRSSSVNAEIESPIEGAIQYCKQSIYI